MMKTDSEEQSDEHLLALAQKGSELAFGLLLERYYPLIFRTAFKWSGHQQDAEEIAQEACIKIGHHINSFRLESAFSSWIYRIVVNLVKDRQRSQKMHWQHTQLQQEIGSSPMALSDQLSPESTLENEQLWQLVRRLPEKLSDAVLLVYGEGLTHAEAAQVLGCAQGTVSWYILEAKKLLMQRVQQDER